MSDEKRKKAEQRMKALSKIYEGLFDFFTVDLNKEITDYLKGETTPLADYVSKTDDKDLN